MLYGALIEYYRISYILYKLINYKYNVRFNNNYNVGNAFNKFLINL
jgi:hypothetical protein